MLHNNKKNAQILRHTLLVGVIGISPSITIHTSQYFHHIQFILYIFGNTPHFFHRNTWQCDFPPISQGRKREKLIRLPDIIPRTRAMIRCN